MGWRVAERDGAGRLESRAQLQRRWAERRLLSCPFSVSQVSTRCRCLEAGQAQEEKASCHQIRIRPGHNLDLQIPLFGSVRRTTVQQDHIFFFAAELFASANGRRNEHEQRFVRGAHLHDLRPGARVEDDAGREVALEALPSGIRSWEQAAGCSL